MGRRAQVRRRRAACAAGALGLVALCGPPAVALPELPALKLPRHCSNSRVNSVLQHAEGLVHRRGMHGGIWPEQPERTSIGLEDRVFANAYVNLDAAKVVGFDYDYTLVSYTPALLSMLYDIAKNILVTELSYPVELRTDLAGYDPTFAIRGLAVDLKTAWICKLTTRHKVAIAFFGRERVDPETTSNMYKSSKGAGVVAPTERKKRLRPLNDLFSLVEACLLADVVQWFRDRNIPFEPTSIVNDVLQSVGKAHTTGAMHKAVVQDLDKYIDTGSKTHMRQFLKQLRAAGKQLMLVSNSEFWYVDAGMKYVVGSEWRSLFNIVVVQAGKPGFYTQAAPFREVSTRTGRIKFKPVTALDPEEVYSQGSIVELMRLANWTSSESMGPLDGSSICYFGDSLFADLVEARRLYGWTTGAIIRELREEMLVQTSSRWRHAQRCVCVLLHTAKRCQELMGPRMEEGIDRQQPHSREDRELLDALERLVTEWRQRQDECLNANFGSIFKASCNEGVRSMHSLFASCLQRHVDLYTSSVENLRLYSTDHRFYPTEERMGIPHEDRRNRDLILDLELDEGQLDR